MVWANIDGLCIRELYAPIYGPYILELHPVGVVSTLLSASEPVSRVLRVRQVIYILGWIPMQLSFHPAESDPLGYFGCRTIDERYTVNGPANLGYGRGSLGIYTLRHG